DGGRLITGGEEMTIATRPHEDLLWITRVHPYNKVALDIYADGALVAKRLIPAIPGQWLEIATLIPGNFITGNATRLRVEANITNPSVGHFMPYYHWFYQGTYLANTTVTLSGPEATFDGWIKLAGHQMTYDPQSRRITVKLQWIGGEPLPYRPSALVDAKIF